MTNEQKQTLYEILDGNHSEDVMFDMIVELIFQIRRDWMVNELE